jgi:hypothetical protein
MKSYGRAPNFLMLTGYEQVRSIACVLTGDTDGALNVELTLPATGVCSSDARSSEAAACCRGPAPASVDACCVLDAEAKAAGHSGCGGSSHAAETAASAQPANGAAASTTIAVFTMTEMRTQSIAEGSCRPGPQPATWRPGSRFAWGRRAS